MKLRVYMLLCLVLSACHAKVQPAPPLRAKTIYGHEVASIMPADHRSHVLFFLSVHCPVTAGTMPEIFKIMDEYSPSQFKFFLIFTDPEADPSKVQKFLHHHGSTADAIMDAGHQLVNHFSVSATPETVVLSPKGETLYQGRINDLYNGQNLKQPYVQHHDLRRILDTLASSRKVKACKTETVGSRISAVH